MLGDVLIYVVLPVNAPLFGVSLFWVGVLLAANRVIRIFTYGAIATFAETIGPRNLAVLCAVFAALSTLTYGLATGWPILLAARITWGLCFAALTLVVFAYAVADRSKAGTHVGFSRAIQQICPTLVLFIGPLAAAVVGAKDIFTWLGIISAAAIPLALTLPKEGRKPKRKKTEWLPTPTRFDLFLFTAGFTVDGVFAMAITLTVAQDASIGTAMVAGGVLLGIRRGAESVLSPIGGMLGDKYGPARLLFLSTTATVAGFALLALEFVYAGGLLAVAGRAFIAALWPAEIAQRATEEETLRRLAVGQTWRDVGAAAGPLAAGSLMALVTLDQLYWAMGALVATGLWLQKR